ncbi:TPA: AAA family ATPase [Acinetobacter baumannii]|nr:AAA family ATPase [Acinetobacter baumannii]
MRIDKAEIKNFRKLKDCSISFSEDQTILVGANNSGKTSAIKAFKLFLSDKGTAEGFKYTDFTFDNWAVLNSLAANWLTKGSVASAEEIYEWNQYCPTLDLYIQVESNEIHHVIDFLPSLEWDGGLIGLRIRLELKNIEDLKSDFVELCTENQRISNKSKIVEFQDLWPNNNIQEFLSRHLDKYFKLKYYVVDPSKNSNEEILLEKNEPLKGLIKVNVIDDDAGFFNSNGAKDLLSNIIQKYYKTHFDRDDRVKTENDLRAIKAVNTSKNEFDSTLSETFSAILDEIKNLGYPGSKNDPNISISSKINQIESLGHEGAIRFRINNNDDGDEVKIPEGLNGLGFRRLISITLELISFRESWLRNNKLDQSPIEPLHLMLIEEPEAHLHAQVQQVFIKKAYSTLCTNKPEHCSCQLLVSTHSSYLAKELDFSKLRYFKRKNNGLIPHSEVIDLSKTFSDEELQNSKFVTRYIQTTHCDLFFANGVILVEGDAERLLVPHFIKNHFEELNQCYISILSVGGAHAHRLRELIEKLDIPCLIITDIDSVKKDYVRIKNKEYINKLFNRMRSKKNSFELLTINPYMMKPDITLNDNKKIKMKEIKVFPDMNKSLFTNNDTLKKWIPRLKNVDDLLALDANNKVIGNIRVCFQTKILIDFRGQKKLVYPYTFEEAIFFDNREILKANFTTLRNNSGEKVKATGVLYKMLKAEENEDFSNYRNEIFSSLESNKVDMAMDLIYGIDPKVLQTPEYIQEGLTWLQKEVLGDNFNGDQDKLVGGKDAA